MPKMTLQQQAAQHLERLGYIIDKSRRKRWIATRGKELHKYYLGNAGSVRRGTTLAESFPVKLLQER